MVNCRKTNETLTGYSFVDFYFFHRVKDKMKLQQAFTVNPVYLRHGYSQVVDFMVWCSWRVTCTDTHKLKIKSQIHKAVARLLLQKTLQKCDEVQIVTGLCQTHFNIFEFINRSRMTPFTMPRGNRSDVLYIYIKERRAWKHSSTYTRDLHSHNQMS